MRVSQQMKTLVLCPCLTEANQFAKFVTITAVFWDVTVFWWTGTDVSGRKTEAAGYAETLILVY
jgi:hypothetical protein